MSIVADATLEMVWKKKRCLLQPQRMREEEGEDEEEQMKGEMIQRNDD